ncbi:MAG: VOC family protein [Chloroflexi bacterium]|nr:VOC family protein [Chloroflexota bacterium]
MARVVHFEIHADDLARAVKFYTDTFGWEFTKWDAPVEYWLIKTGPANEPGIDGGMLKRNHPLDGKAITAYICTLDVASIDDSIAKVTRNGGQIALPKDVIPGVGWLAYGIDTEGNIFGMMQADPNAQMK